MPQGTGSSGLGARPHSRIPDPQWAGVRGLGRRVCFSEPKHDLLGRVWRIACGHRHGCSHLDWVRGEQNVAHEGRHARPRTRHGADPVILSRGGLGPFIGFRLNIPAAPTSTRRTIRAGPASRSRTCSHAGQRQRPIATAYRMRGKRTARGRHRSAAEALQPPVLPCRRHLRLQ